MELTGARLTAFRMLVATVVWVACLAVPITPSVTCMAIALASYAFVRPRAATLGRAVAMTVAILIGTGIEHDAREAETRMLTDLALHVGTLALQPNELSLVAFLLIGVLAVPAMALLSAVESDGARARSVPAARTVRARRPRGCGFMTPPPTTTA